MASTLSFTDFVIPAAGICMRHPETHMSSGMGAMLWNPGGYKKLRRE
jgi:hypothetical protein